MTERINILTLPRTGSTYLGWCINYHMFGNADREWIELFDNPNPPHPQEDRDFFLTQLLSIEREQPQLIKTHQFHLERAKKAGVLHKVRSALDDYQTIVLLRKDFFEVALSHAIAVHTGEWKFYRNEDQITIDTDNFKRLVVNKWDETNQLIENVYEFEIYNHVFYEDFVDDSFKDFQLTGLPGKVLQPGESPYQKAPPKSQVVTNIDELKDVARETLAWLNRRDDKETVKPEDMQVDLQLDRKRIKPKWLPTGELDPTSPNKVFCMAPWTHTYLSPQGERRMCCASREEHSFQKQYIDASNDPELGDVKASKTDADDFNPVSLEEYWNSPYMMDIRKKLMKGEKIPQCQVCNEDVLSVSAYRKWFTGVLFKDKIDEAFEKTDEDGRTTMPVISFDYRYSNLCNFKCRMCGELLSSSWEAEKKKHNLWSIENQPFMQKDVKAKMNNFQRNVAEPEFKQAISDGIIEEIYWVGGEPLMYDIHWWALEEMVNNGSAKNCYLRYNSNLSRVEFKGKKLYDYLPQFKNWIMCASIDGTGDVVEFIRKGIVWEEWLENFKAGLELPDGNNKMVIDLTITGPGMFSVADLVDLAIELDVSIETKIMFAFHPDIVFSPFAWPRHILDRHINEILAYIKPRVTNRQMSVVRTLEEMKTRPTFEEKWPDTHEREFFKGRLFQEKLDRIRQEQYRIEDIYARDPELHKWWTREQKQ